MQISYSYRDLAIRPAGALETASRISYSYRELGQSRYKRADSEALVKGLLRKIFATVGVCLLLIVGGFTAYRLTRGCDVSAMLLTEAADAVKYDKELLSDIAAIGIGRSSDPWALFEEFAKRFSLIETNDKQSGLRDIQRIVKAGGGDRDELRFVLHNLFRLNDINSEWVEVYSSRDAARELDRAKAIRKLVFAPDLDQIFDVALPPASQHRGAGRALLDGKTRVHFQETIITTYLCENSAARSSLTSLH